MSRRNNVPTSRLEKTRELNKRLSKKKSNIKSRHGIVIDIPRIDAKLPAKEWRAQVRQVESFLNPHNTEYQYVRNENGVSLSRKYVNQYKREVARINRIKKREYDILANMEFKDKDHTYGLMKDVKLPNAKELDDFRPLVFNINYFTSNEGLKNRLTNLHQSYGGNFIRKQRILYKENYLKSLETVFGSGSDLEGLKNYIRSIPDVEFYMITETHAGLHIRFVYDERDRDDKLQGLMSDWNYEYYLDEMGAKAKTEKVDTRLHTL